MLDLEYRFETCDEELGKLQMNKDLERRADLKMRTFFRQSMDICTSKVAPF